MAYSSARSDIDRYIRPGRAQREGGSDRGNPALAMWCGLRLTRSIGMAPRSTAAMTHIAIQEALDGKVVEWMEQVIDEQYLSGTQENR